MWKFLLAFFLSQSGQIPADDQGGENEREDQNTGEEVSQDDLTGVRQPYEATDTDDNQPDPNSNNKQQSEDPSFIDGLNLDPKTFSPENQAIFKKMQGNYTKFMQGNRELQNKAQVYDRFYNDKEFARQTLLAFAAQEGYQLSPINQPATVQDPKQANVQTPNDLVELLKSNLDPSLHWTAEGNAKAIQAVMSQLLKPVFEATEAQKKYQETQKQQQVNSEWDRLAGEFSERQPGWESQEDRMSKILSFIGGPDMTHPEFGSKFDLLFQLATSKGAALAEATNRVNRAAKNATPVSTAGKRTVNQRPIQDEVADTADSADAFKKASQYALAQARSRRK